MRALLLLVVVLAPPAAFAARPFVTDDARIVDKGGYQIETYVKVQSEHHEREFWFLPACNPWGPVELTLGGNRIDSAPAGDSDALVPQGDSNTLILQGKTLLKRLETNGYGLALTLGVARNAPSEGSRTTNPYVNGISSISFLDDRAVLHVNAGAIRDQKLNATRGTWGIGTEVLLVAPRLYGIIEQYGIRFEKPTFHIGLRFWIVPNRVQTDATVGQQHASPFDRRFGSIGLRILW